ncbi:E3 ubiquitin-protein ligase RNF25 isoform X1 [Phyllopteryx taeniolatus]|uniref:E3 ubiquitin-protein ligase RNF25 isoform X1 n=1 Tax=Phyllopteryx taeniolatus TaxID=161469 RepID=UPI002AD333A6|nr:E3 ubiquitin-protein ligase RNF25 isoform X1 [Phyllopteryx taeniolatus]
MAATESEVLCEIEVLQSIYLDDLRVTRTQDRRWEVSLVLYPSTAEDSGSQFVRLNLTLTLDDQYPCSSPDISIHNPRGLSDDKISSLQQSLELEAESYVGSPVLYQLIEKAKEILTESNIPHGNCVICLYGFKEGESFSKTRCYHYFHSHCLGRYARHSEEEIRVRQQEMAKDKTATQLQELTVVCPVCREPLTYDLDQLMASVAPQLPELDAAAICSDFQQKWRELERVLDRQRCRGGVIDPKEESNRFLIHINEAPSSPDGGGEDPPLPAACELPPPLHHVAPRPTHCSGTHWQPHGQPQARKRHSHGRGPRRGSAGPRTYHTRGGAPISEHLDSLCLSSDPTEGAPRATCEDVCAHLTLHQTGSHSSSFDKHTAAGRAQRARRRGPQHLAHGGPPQHRRWDARAPRGGAPRQQRVGGPEEDL